MIDAYFKLSNTLTAKLGLHPADLLHHHSWSPGRKIDCARADAVQGSWKPRSVNSSGSWSLEDTQDEAIDRTWVPPVTPPKPPPLIPAPPLTKDDDSMIVALDSNGTAWIGDGMTRFQPTEAQYANYVVLGKAGCYRFVNTSGGGVAGWPDVRTVGADTLSALGRPVA
jgi:hypothetical protein